VNTFNTTNLTHTEDTANTVQVTSESAATSPIRPSTGRQVGAAVGFLGIVAAVAFLGSLATTPNTDGWYADVERVAWSPPNAVFGPAWTLLYFLIAVAGFLIWRAGFSGSAQKNRARGALVLFVIQLVLNFAWSPIFFAGYPMFGEPAWWLAMAVILVLIGFVIALIAVGRRSSKAAAWLLLPYLAWLIFASTLNAGIIYLN
jgi:benzodiazapine receptor